MEYNFQENLYPLKLLRVSYNFRKKTFNNFGDLLKINYLS